MCAHTQRLVSPFADAWGQKSPEGQDCVLGCGSLGTRSGPGAGTLLKRTVTVECIPFTAPAPRQVRLCSDHVAHGGRAHNVRVQSGSAPGFSKQRGRACDALGGVAPRTEAALRLAWPDLGACPVRPEASHHFGLGDPFARSSCPDGSPQGRSRWARTPALTNFSIASGDRCLLWSGVGGGGADLRG